MDKCCATCRYCAELKRPYERSDGTTIYGYCFKDGDKDYSLSMGKGLPARAEVFRVPGYADGWNNAIRLITNAPTVDAVQVRHGRWINKRGGFWEVATCSECREVCPTAGIVPKYCPGCGAKMDGDADG